MSDRSCALASAPAGGMKDSQVQGLESTVCPACWMDSVSFLCYVGKHLAGCGTRRRRSLLGRCITQVLSPKAPFGAQACPDATKTQCCRHKVAVPLKEGSVQRNRAVDLSRMCRPYYFFLLKDSQENIPYVNVRF